jgi:hypothetical protein
MGTAGRAGEMMFKFLSKERLYPLDDFPQSSPGAPCPTVIATDYSTHVIFYLHDLPVGWDGKSVRPVDLKSEGSVAILTLENCFAHQFGPPGDEDISGHPLYSQGLGPYGAFRVERSRWLAELEQRNSVHPYHKKAKFLANKVHYIFTFHDSTLEAIASGFNIRSVKGSIKEVAARILEGIDG